MTFEEARKLAAIAATIDHGCKYCVRDFVRLLNETFHEFKWGSVRTDTSPFIEVTVSPVEKE